MHICLEITPQGIVYNRTNPSSPIYVQVELVDGKIRTGKMKFFHFSKDLSLRKISTINSYGYENCKKNLLETMNSYSSCQGCPITGTQAICHYVFYVMFFSLAHTKTFYEIYPISAHLPLSHFEQIISRGFFPVSRFLFETMARVAKDCLARDAAICLQNFVSLFDLMFPCNYVPEQLEISSFTISIICFLSMNALKNLESSQNSHSNNHKLLLEHSLTETKEKDKKELILEDKEESLDETYGKWLRKHPDHSEIAEQDFSEESFNETYGKWLIAKGSKNNKKK